MTRARHATTAARPWLAAVCVLLCLYASSAPARSGIELHIGLPLKGAWVSEGVPGQGFLVEVIVNPQVLFIAWFTFPRPSEGLPLDALPQRWYTIEGAGSAGVVQATIYQTGGGSFLGPDAVEQQPVGTASVRFFDCNHGEIAYHFKDSGEQGSIAIRRAVPVPESECDALVEPQAVPEQVDAEQASVIVNATVLDMPSGELLPGQMVVVEEGIISYAGPTQYALIPDDAVLIDGRGRYLLPGMVDTHTHLATNVREFLGLGASSALVEQSARSQLILYLSRGVTTILNAGDFGEPLPRWDSETVSGVLPGPTIYAAKYARGDRNTPDGGPPGVEIIDAAQARAFTQQAHADGYDFMKIYNHTPRDGVLAILEEAGGLGMPVLGHFPQTMNPQEALVEGLEMVAHSGAYLWRWFNTIGANEALLDQAVELTVQHGASVSATLGIEELINQVWCADPSGVAAYWAREETQYMHPTTVSLNLRSINAEWRWNPDGCSSGGYAGVAGFVLDFARRLHQGGARLLMGTDSPTVLGVPGYSAVDEVQALVNAGISLVDALRIATWNGGQFISETLELELPFGAIRAGWRADLVLLSDNPLQGAERLHAVVGVMARGRWKSRAWFDLELQAIAQQYAN